MNGEFVHSPEKLSLRQVATMVVLQLFILSICISRISTSVVLDYRTVNDTDTCILPAYPRNGYYKILEPPNSASKPGDHLDYYTLDVICDPGYSFGRERTTVRCLSGLKVSTPLLCIPRCKKEVAFFPIFSCGIGRDGEESRCLMPNEYTSLAKIDLKKDLENRDLDCGAVETDFSQVVVGGRPALSRELPWHAGIYKKTTRPFMQICGGSLVRPTVVISAAHCFWTDLGKLRPAADYAVAVGKLTRPWTDESGDVQRSDVADIRLPPRFQGFTTNMQDDIALVIVATAFVYGPAVTPVCLDFDYNFDNRQLSEGKLGKVAGWGLTSEDGYGSPVLKVVEMPMVDISRCIAGSDPGFLSHITSDKICAGYQNGTAVCKGDSGGGLAFPEIVNHINRFFLRGVVSAAPRSNHLCNTLAWATFTHVIRHEHFIGATLSASPSTPVAETKPVVFKAAYF